MKLIRQGVAVFLTMLLIMPTIPVFAQQEVVSLQTPSEILATPSEPQKTEEKQEENTEKEEGTESEETTGNESQDLVKDVESVGTASEVDGEEDKNTDASKNKVKVKETSRAGGTAGGITWAIDANGTLTVDGTGDFSSETGVDRAPWYSERSAIKSAVVNVTGITNTSYMFMDCSSLTTLDISGLDTSLVTDMLGMFAYCSSLTALDVSNMNTSQVTDMSYMFFRCNSLTALDVSNLDTGQVTSMSYMFKDCIGLTTLKIAGLNTEKVTDMSYMFCNCCNLSVLDVSGLNTSQVTNMNSMFMECKEVEILDVSGFDTSNVVSMAYLFGSCSKVKTLNVRNFKTNNVQYMYNMFAGCLTLENLDLSSFDTSNVTSMMSMFYNCQSLTNLDLHNFNTSNVTNMAYMFVNCWDLKEVNFTGWNTGQLVSVDEMFYYCTNITELDLSSFSFASISSVKDMFIGCSNLCAIETPQNVKTSVNLYGSNNASHRFWYDPDGNVITEVPQNLASSISIYKSTPQDLPQAVKYILYEESIKRIIGTTGTVRYALKDGTLPSGMELKTDGVVAGIPMEMGSFSFAVSVTVDGSPEGKVMWYVLQVLDNADVNVEDMTDSGYELVEYVPDFRLGTLSGDGDQLMVSKGEYGEFQDLYLDGVKLTKGTDYTGEAGSTRLTIRNQTLARVGGGRHTLAMEFRTTGDNSLRKAAQNYEVTDTSGSGNSGGGSSNSSGGGNGGGSRPAGNGNNQPGVSVIQYIVVSGDSLWKIAEKFYGSGQYWTKVYADNSSIIRNPNQIYVGQVIQIYRIKSDNTTIIQGGTDTYTVQVGDSLWKISEKIYGKGKKWRKIYQANTSSISDPKRIFAGQILVIPEE